MSNYKEGLQLLCAIDELYVAAFIGPEEMCDGVDDIDNMLIDIFRSLNWVVSSGYLG